MSRGKKKKKKRKKKPHATYQTKNTRHTPPPGKQTPPHPTHPNPPPTAPAPSPLHKHKDHPEPEPQKWKPPSNASVGEKRTEKSPPNPTALVLTQDDNRKRTKALKEHSSFEKVKEDEDSKKYRRISSVNRIESNTVKRENVGKVGKFPNQEICGQTP